MWFQALTLPVRSILGCCWHRQRYTEPCRISCPDGGIQKGIGYTGMMPYSKAFMPYKNKYILGRIDGWEVMSAPVFTLACSPRQLPGMLACLSELIHLRGLFGKSKDETRTLAIWTTHLLGILVLTVPCKLAPCLSGFTREIRENKNNAIDCRILFTWSVRYQRKETD